MSYKQKQILAIIIGVLPFYIFNIYVNVSGNIDYNIETVLGKYLVFVSFVLLTIFIFNKLLLKNTLRVFNTHKATLLYDIAIAFLFLICYYFLLSVGQFTYTRWLNENIDQTEVLNLIRAIYSNSFYTALLFGPFVILTQGTWVISSAFVLNNLWGLSRNKLWDWLIIILVAGIISLVNYHNGIQGIIFWFTVNLMANIFYYKYRRVTPLLIAFYLFQYFDAIGLWFYLKGL